MNTTFELEKRKNKEGITVETNMPIRLVVTFNRQRVTFYSGYRVDKSKWCTGNEQGKDKNPRNRPQRVKHANNAANGVPYNIVNGRLDDMLKVVTDYDLRCSGNKETPDKEILKQLMSLALGKEKKVEAQPEEANKTFLSLFDDFVSQRGKENDWTDATFEKFAAVRNHLMGFSQSLTFELFNEEGLGNYVSFLRDKKDMRNSTIGNQLGFLKWFLRWATAKGYNTEITYQSFTPKLKGNKTDKKIIFLTWDELMTVYNFDIPESKQYLARVRDVFCFCCFTSLRYSDVYNLGRADVRGDAIHITTVKTDDSLTIELNKYSKAILNKYADIAFKNDKALPVISNQKMNDYIKELGQLCGIDEPIRTTYYKGNKRVDEVYPKYELLGTHAGRRTFICNALALGIPAQVVMKWSGHSDYKAMRPYIDVAETVKAEAMKLFDK